MSYICFAHTLRACSTTQPATVKNILRNNGIRGLYRGLGPTILGYLPTWAIYFAVYDGIKSYFGAPPLGGSGPEKKIYPAPHAKGYQPLIREHPWSLHILSAMSAGATSTICTNPLWVIKTRFMVSFPSASASRRRVERILDPNARRSPVQAYPRRRSHHLSHRGSQCVLPRSSAFPPRNSPRCCSIPII